MQVEIGPCKGDCLIYPEDGDYQLKISEFLGSFSILARMLDSRSDFNKFSEPFTLVQSLSFYCFYNRKFLSKRSIIFQQIIVETSDGFLWRNRRKDISLTQKDTIQKMRTRESVHSPFGIITFELDNSKTIVDRRYATFIEMLGRFGGIARVIIISVFTLISLHHAIVMQKYLINDAILKKTQEELEKYQKRLSN